MENKRRKRYEIRLKFDDELEYKIGKEMMQKEKKTPKQFFMSVRYLIHTRAHMQEVINRNFDNMKSELPEEMHGTISTLRAIALNSTNMDEEKLLRLASKLMKEG